MLAAATCTTAVVGTCLVDLHLRRRLLKLIAVQTQINTRTAGTTMATTPPTIPPTEEVDGGFVTELVSGRTVPVTGADEVNYQQKNTA